MGQGQSHPSVPRPPIIFESPLSLPGPHGYPMRFGVRLAGLKGFKIYGADPKQPCHYVELHARRQILHESAHKRDKSRVLVTVQENWPSRSLFPLDDELATFTITVHGNKAASKLDGNGDGDGDGSENDNGNIGANSAAARDTVGQLEVADQIIDMDHVRCRPVTFQFQLAVPTITTTPKDTRNSDGANTTLETFKWRRAPPACQETRGIRKKTLPVLETGDERLPEERFVYAPSGSVLVRLGPNGKRCAPGRDRPLGFTRAGEEIVASYTGSRDYGAWYYFQFWGAGATGELGETFTHVAVMTGMAVYQDEEDETARSNKRKLKKDEIHGVRPAVSTGMPRKAARPGCR
ncbi:hypothetical protein VTI28DRAFT_5965 [Corynascus sepedonium]